jgi:hypothetical protein
MNAGDLCDVTFCRFVNICDVSKDRAALIFEVKQSKRDILDSFDCEGERITLVLKAR